MVERGARLHELLPAEGFTDAELAREIQRADQVEGMVAAYKAERIAELAARRPRGPTSPQRRLGRRRNGISGSRRVSRSSSPTSWR